jgi:transcriptional regulator with GAF, ATPase, and Fis domain
VAVYARRGDVLYRVAAFGPHSPFAVDSIHLITGATDVARVVAEGSQAVVDSQYAKVYSDGFTPAQRLLIALMVGNECVGVLLVDTPQAGVFGQSLLALARAYAGVAAMAVDARRTAIAARAPVPSVTASYGAAPVAISHEVPEPCEELERCRSSSMRDVVARARQVARTDAPVLIIGEPGCGKRYVARAIVGWSERSDGPFVTLECDAHPVNELERLLFGDAVRPGGLIAAAGQGTLLLANVESLPLSLQVKLLEVLQHGSYRTVGSLHAGNGHLHGAQFRLLATSRTELQDSVNRGAFRADLHERLAVFPLRVPALRERSRDAWAIAQQFIVQRMRRGDSLQLSTRAQQWLCEYSWPGNVAELLNVLERAAMLRPSGMIDVDVLPAASPAHVVAPSDDRPSTFPSFVDNERSYFERALTLTSGKLHGADGAASLVGLKPTTLQSRLKKLGIQPRMWKRRAIEQKAAPISGVQPYGTNLRSTIGSQ